MLMVCTVFLLRIILTLVTSFLPLGATAQGELWPPEQSASIIFCSEAVWFLNNLVFMV
jgi:hypothetical protein